MMIQRALADGITGVGLVSSPLWLEYVSQGLEFSIVVGGVAIMAMRLWLLWQEIQERKKDDEG